MGTICIPERSQIDKRRVSGSACTAVTTIFSSQLERYSSYLVYGGRIGRGSSASLWWAEYRVADERRCITGLALVDGWHHVDAIDFYTGTGLVVAQ